MIKIFAIICFVIISLQVTGIAQDTLVPCKYWIQFTDKQGTSYNINKPEEFLSSKAIARRNKYNIPIKVNDLPVSMAYIDSVQKSGAVYLIHQQKWLNSITVFSFDTIAIEKIKNYSFVKNVQSIMYSVAQKNTVKKAEIPIKTTNGTIIGTESTMYSDEFYGYSFHQIDMLETDELHKRGYTGKGMLIAVIDNGFNNAQNLTVYNKLLSDNQIVGMYDFVDLDTDVYSTGNHGTYVLSFMAAYQPGTLVGTAPDASYLLLRTENSVSENIIEEIHWVSAAEYADSAGADIISSSLGYTQFDFGFNNHTQSDMNGNTTPVSIGADIAASKGILVVNSAGNSGDNAWQTIVAPSDGDSVIAVAAVDADRIRASFSSIGPNTDNDIKPNVAAQGHLAYFANTDNTIAQGNGTSFSCPIISGSAACLWQAFPNLSNIEIKQLIEKSAHKANNPDKLLGYGIPNFYKAYKSASIGFSPNLQNQFFAYPNPFTDNFSITYLWGKNEQFATIALYNYLGQEMIRKDIYLTETTFNEISFKNLQNLNNGIYYVIIWIDNETVSIPLLKITK